MSAAFVPSRTTDLADIDPTPPTNSQVLVWIASTSKWTPGSGGGNVASVFGRTGVVVAQAGDYAVGQVTGAAPLASPAFTGTPTAPTAALGTNTTQVATTAFVLANAGSGAVASVFGRTGVVVAQAGDYAVAQVTGAAPLASPAFTGTPTAPTAAPGTNTTQIATTAFVLANGGAVSSVFGRTGAVVAQAGDYTAAQVGAQAASATLTALASASYTSSRILYGDGSGVPVTSVDLRWDTSARGLRLLDSYSMSQTFMGHISGFTEYFGIWVGNGGYNGLTNYCFLATDGGDARKGPSA